MKSLVWLLLFIFVLTGCENLALLSTPHKQPINSTSKSAEEAQRYFWKTLHQGRYQDIPQADYLLMAAYLKNPNDPKLAAHLGFLHIWKITERNQALLNPLITNEIILAKKYFADALMLQPNNAIYEGFLGDSQLVEGQIFHDEREKVSGYFTLKKAIAKWPEFNYFTAGYPMSTLPHTSQQFQEGLSWQWATLDVCAGKRINRKHPDYQPFMTRGIKTPHQSACWNTWIAPYNFEGFFMNMGDMLVKSGDWQTGILIYENAKLAKNYHSWPYRSLLEQRIQHAKENVGYFRQNQTDPNRTVMFNSGHGCMVCHQKS